MQHDGWPHLPESRPEIFRDPRATMNQNNVIPNALRINATHIEEGVDKPSTYNEYVYVEV